MSIYLWMALSFMDGTLEFSFIAIAIGPVYVFAELEMSHTIVSRQQCHHSKLTTKNHIYDSVSISMQRNIYIRKPTKSVKKDVCISCEKFCWGKKRTDQPTQERRKEQCTCFNDFHFVGCVCWTIVKEIHHFQLYKCTFFSLFLYSWFRTKELFQVRLMHKIVLSGCFYLLSNALILGGDRHIKIQK